MLAFKYNVSLSRSRFYDGYIKCFSVPSSNPSQQQDSNRPPPGAAIPPNNSGPDMSQGGGPQGGPSDPNLNAPKFSGRNGQILSDIRFDSI